jgi:hypothetical protein
MNKFPLRTGAALGTLCLYCLSSCATIPWRDETGGLPPGGNYRAALPKSGFWEKMGTIFYMYSRSFDGKKYITGEADVVKLLQEIQSGSRRCTFRAFERRAFRPTGLRTQTLIHSFYVIEEEGMGPHTLSFTGTMRFFYSQGAWALDVEADIESYLEFTAGNNIWDVHEILPGSAIDTWATSGKILQKIKAKTRYYYNDHLDNWNGYDNCNTALWETITLAGKQSRAFRGAEPERSRFLEGLIPSP